MFAGLICGGDPRRPPSAARSFFINQRFYSQRRTNKYFKFVVSDYRNWGGSIVTEHSTRVSQPLTDFEAPVQI